MPSARLLLICMFVVLQTYHVGANQAVSGKISYYALNDSTYKVIFKYFDWCGALGEPSTIDLCVYNTCTNQSFNTLMQKLSSGGNSGKQVKYSCGAESSTRCTNPSSPIPGVEEWWYSVDIVLPMRCSTWRFSTIVYERDQSVNIEKRDLYTEATLNNVIVLQNTSAEYTIAPLYILRQNSNSTINLGAIDADGDSLVTKLVPTLTSTSCFANATIVPVKTLTPAINTTTNPLPCSNTFSLNQQNGSINFTPGMTDKNYLTFKTEEYRNNQLIATNTHDVFIEIFNHGAGASSPAFNPIISSANGATWNNNQMQVCIGTPVQMCFYFKSAIPGAIMQMSDNMSQVFPGSSISYTPYGDSVVGCINWTPSENDNKSGYVYLSAIDVTCSPVPIHFHSNRVFSVYVTPKIKVSNDTTICNGEKAQLNASGGFGNFTWSILSGTPASLTCTSCTSPQANPVIASSYVAVSGNSICPGNPNYRDTVNVKIHSVATTNPTVSAAAIPGTTIQKDSTVEFRATFTNCGQPVFKWYKNGTQVPGVSTATWTTNTINDGDVITCEFTCNDLCPLPRKQTSTAITMKVISGVNELNKNEDVQIVPNPNTGTFTLDVNDASKIHSLEIFDITGRCIYKSATAGKKEVLHINAAPGIYSVKITSDQRVYNTKMVVR